jgi:hypothetical protein
VDNEKLLFTDFGLAFDTGSLSTSVTYGQPAFRTVKYCAPEVADWDRRGRGSDVFSLGCVLMEVWSTLTGLGPDHPEGFSWLSPFHINLGRARQWIVDKLRNSRPTMHECDNAWLTACRSMISDRETRPTAQDLLLDAYCINNAESMAMLFCTTYIPSQLDHIPAVGRVRTSSLIDELSCIRIADKEISNGSSRSSYRQSPLYPKLSTVLVKTSQDLGFRSIESLPPSLIIALNNRFTASQLEYWTRPDSGCRTLFAAGSWLYPSVLWCKLRHKSLLDFATCYAPAIVRGLRRLAVEGMTLPAIVEGTDTDEVHGMMILGIPKHHRVPSLDDSEHIIVPSRAVARTELDDGSIVEREVDSARWVGGKWSLEVTWSPSDLMESEWFKEQVLDAQEEEELLKDSSRGLRSLGCEY